jgi:hypothetical protein
MRPTPAQARIAVDVLLHEVDRELFLTDDRAERAELKAEHRDLQELSDQIAEREAEVEQIRR